MLLSLDWHTVFTVPTYKTGSSQHSVFRKIPVFTLTRWLWNLVFARLSVLNYISSALICSEYYWSKIYKYHWINKSMQTILLLEVKFSSCSSSYINPSFVPFTPSDTQPFINPLMIDSGVLFQAVLNFNKQMDNTVLSWTVLQLQQKHGISKAKWKLFTHYPSSATDGLLMFPAAVNVQLLDSSHYPHTQCSQSLSALLLTH